MALVFSGKVLADLQLWLWRIEETESFFLERINLSNADRDLLARYTAPSRRLEWLASRFVLQQTLGENVSIDYNLEGKPLLMGAAGNISISHSHRLAAVLYHPTLSVGVDVERVSVRPAKVVSRFLDEQEQLLVEKDEAFEAITRAWCSKEALFKLMGQHCFTFIGDFKLTSNLKPNSVEAVFYLEPIGATQTVFFQKSDDHVVAYTVNQNIRP